MNEERNGQDHGRLIRPYVITGGRTTTRGAEISLEAQIETTISVRGDTSRYRWEAKRLLDLCREPMALIEVAARLEVPIGVARIVADDLLREGLIEVREQQYGQTGTSASAYTDLLEKVLDGIRNL